MTSLPNRSASAQTRDASPRDLKVRALIFIVSFLGLLIVAGLVAVILRIIYLSSTPSAQRATTDAAEAPSAADRLDLPAGAVVKSMSVGGDRLAVHYDAPGGGGIAILDLATGTVLRRVDIVPGGTAP
jgi:hypothetical protein